MKHIRIISPSGAIDPQWIDAASSRLRSWGYRVSEGTFARGRYGRFAGTAAERITDLNLALHDPSVDIVLCSRGGYGLQQLIDEVDLSAMSPANKVLVGFSDITELLQLFTREHVPSLHGLMCKHIAEKPESDPLLQLWRQALDGQPLHYTLPAHLLNRQGEACGTLIGGNLSVLYGLQGTAWGLNAIIDSVETMGRKAILFIEDIGERHYHIDRMMQNLRLSGVLSRIGGLVIGQFSDCDEDELMKSSIYETIYTAAAAYSYPVVVNFPAGHVEENSPLWMGRETTIKVTGTGCELLQ